MLREEDRRTFKRYASEAECEVLLPSGTCRGRVIDYSDGAGLFIEDGCEVEQGTEITVRIFDSGLEIHGTVAWTERAEGRIKAGIKRIGSYRGDLKDFRLADILMGINRSSATGVLVIRSGSAVKKIVIERGDMIFATSDRDDDRLGEHLLKKGRITLLEFEKAADLLMRTGQKLGKILVELCCLTPRELFQEVRQQTEDIIVSLFSLEEGVFEFKEGAIASEEIVPLQISAANIIYRGMKKVNNFVQIRQMCPSSEDILNPTLDPLLIYQSIDLDRADKKILSYVNGVYPLKTILSLSPLPDFETLKTIAALMTVGIIYVKEQDEAPAELPVDEIFGERETVPPGFLEKIEDRYRICHSAGYYQVLDVHENASPGDIRKAYLNLLKEFHPDRHFSYQSAGIKGKLLGIVGRVTEAYEVLSDPDQRKEYDEMIRTGGEWEGQPEKIPTMEETLGLDKVYGDHAIPGREGSLFREFKKARSRSKLYNPLTDESRDSLNRTYMPLPVSEDEGRSVSHDMPVPDTDEVSREEETGAGESEGEKQEESISSEPPLSTESAEGSMLGGAETQKEVPLSSGEPEKEVSQGRETDDAGKIINGSLQAESVPPEEDRYAAAERKEPETAGLAEAIEAAETGSRRSLWSYWPAVLAVVLVLGIAIPAIRERIREKFYHPPPAASETPPLPPFRDDAFVKASLDNTAKGNQSVSFRDQAFK